MVTIDSENGMISKWIIFIVVCFATLYGMASPEINPWLGKWEYAEFWPNIDRSGVEIVEYKLTLKQEDSKLVADLDMDGYMTLRRIRADCVLVRKGINVVFDESRQDDKNWSNFVKGDVLFRLERNHKGILTYWKKLRPTLPKNEKVGIYFKKKS